MGAAVGTFGTDRIISLLSRHFGMAADPESDELIRTLLEEDEGAEALDPERGDRDDSNDSDYCETPARKKPRKAKQRGGAAGATTNEEKTRRRRKDVGVRREPGRNWSEEEEVRFLEALEVHGRDWKSCAEHVGTRDCKSVSSHAQKHFIKLCLQGKPLPEKVAETGLGYTLSGKPLDPRSSTAISYGFKDSIIYGKNRVTNRENCESVSCVGLNEEAFEIAQQGIQIEKLGERDQPESMDVPQEMLDIPKDTEQDLKQMSLDSDDKESISVKKEPLVKREATTSKRNLVRSIKPPQDDSWEYLRKYRTDYALNRPQRAAARNRRVQMGTTSESIQLVECEEFMNDDEDGGISQPFTIDIAAEALLVMDFHAHLSEYEIIGLLAGTWDGDRRHLTIREAMPCERAEGSGARTSVELDPASEVTARAEMATKEFVGTGWYHSHPVFTATPSLKDIENQRNYQTLFRQEGSKAEPFIGLIVSPYDPGLPSPKSRIYGFFVMERDLGIKPFRLRYNVVDQLRHYSPFLVDRCEKILEMTKDERCRMDLKATWRHWTFERDDKQVGEPLTKIAKLKISLMSHFAEDGMFHAKTLAEEIRKRIEQIWGVQFDDNGQPHT